MIRHGSESMGDEGNAMGSGYVGVGAPQGITAAVYQKKGPGKQGLAEMTMEERASDIASEGMWGDRPNPFCVHLPFGPIRCNTDLAGLTRFCRLPAPVRGGRVTDLSDEGEWGRFDAASCCTAGGLCDENYMREGLS